ncbi:MAG: hypothetical protein LBG60_04720 [Bifidobacteriaceae bacterium]|jgi:hypothetical protein|nr:hypothetical protein [Bifidobacteriaceae bacterium]
MVTVLSAETPFTAYGPYLDGPAFDVDAARARRDTWYAQRESAIAECMAAAGFKYHPRDPPAASDLDGMETHLSFDQDVVLVPSLAASRAAVGRHGYGVEPAPDLSLYDDAQAADRENAEYRDGLGDDGRRAYDLALQGFDGVTSDVYTPEAAGCMGEALERYPGEGVAAVDDFLSAYLDLASRLVAVAQSDVALDPRVVELNRQWDLCMVKEGVDVRGEVIPGVNLAWFAAPSPALAYRLAQTEGARSVLGDSAGADELESHRQLTGSAVEVRIALADFDCRAETDYEARLLAVQLELEQAFVEQNRDQLDRMVAAAGG